MDKRNSAVAASAVRLRHAIIFILTTAAIVAFLPRRESQRYHYDVGRPWMYPAFIARFDFPVYKTDEAVQREKDSTVRAFQPYYRYDTSAEGKAVGRMEEDLRSGQLPLPPMAGRVLADRLGRLYRAGIMSQADYARLMEDTSAVVRLVSGKSAQGTPVSCMYSTKTAAEALLADAALAPYAKTLQEAGVDDYVYVNAKYDKARSDTELGDALGAIPLASGMVMSGQKVVDRGEIVDDYTYRVLASLEKELQRRESGSKEVAAALVGQVMYVLLLVALFTIYIYLFRPDYFSAPRSMLMLYSLVALFPVAAALATRQGVVSLYVLPMAMAPIFIRVFMDSRTAYVAHTVIILASAPAVKYQYEFIIVQLVSGIAAIYSLREMSRRAQVFQTALVATVAEAAVFLSLQLMQDNDFAAFDTGQYMNFAAGGVLLLLAYPLMYVMEKAFGFISDITLFELSNTNKGLPLKLSQVAPGTFQHSITVGNLAAEAAKRIGADSLLVKTAALYHDIGKMKAPAFFTENQAGASSHAGLPCEASARIIVSHVTEGMKMAAEANLPKIVSDFICTHHGLGMAKYFYIQCQNDNPGKEIDPGPYMYPGPNPMTREQAVMMMADSVEAASRSLKEYNDDTIKGLVDKIVDGQVEAGCFRDCPVTFRDITQTKAVFVEQLKTIYHTRISYPELNAGEGGSVSPPGGENIKATI